jgi:hypothetical protein
MIGTGFLSSRILADQSVSQKMPYAINQLLVLDMSFPMVISKGFTVVPYFRQRAGRGNTSITTLNSQRPTCMG